MPKIIGISRIRNESEIIQRTLGHVGSLVNEIIVWDDASEDNTAEICRAHPKVSLVMGQAEWPGTPDTEESRQRYELVQEAVRRGADWVYIFDADEYADFTGIDLSEANTFRFRLFDFYITPLDLDKPYYEREWMGPEYRDIMVLFKAHAGLYFKPSCGREPGARKAPVKPGGFIKHYSKAISVERWERDCDFYVKYYGVYRKRWANRKGRAIHALSDFGRPLIKWEDRFDKTKIVALRTGKHPIGEQYYNAPADAAAS